MWAATVGIVGLALLGVAQPTWLLAGKRSFSYGPYAETRLDLFRPRLAHGACPAVLVLHGGGWRMGSRSDMVRRVCLPYLRRGFVVANADYRLTPSARAPAAVVDGRAALAWLQEHAASIGVDPSQLVVTGESAGAYLALMAALPRAGARPVAAVVDFYAPVDLADLLQGVRARDYAREWLAGADTATVRQLSVLPAVDASFPPTVIVHGDADQEIAPSQSARLAAALEQAAVPFRLVTVSGAGHGGWTTRQLDHAYDEVFAFLSEQGVRRR